MFLGNFEGAREDYAKMIELDPTLEVSHWRIGIAYFYLGEFVKAERQFEIYHRYDAVDRENGIWRFMSQTSYQGEEKARKDLLPYEQTDRPPYPWLYEMFQGKIEPDEIFQRIEEAGFSRGYEERVRFHADLYVGIYLELVKGDKKAALQHLRNAVANQYGRATGTYMWQVARLHHARLRKILRVRSSESFPISSENYSLPFVFKNLEWRIEPARRTGAMKLTSGTIQTKEARMPSLRNLVPVWLESEEMRKPTR